MVKHGGKRVGAGRKPLPKNKRKISRTFRLDPKIIKYLTSQKEDATSVLESAIRRTKSFREWDR